MSTERRKPLLGKVVIGGIMWCVTGLHIGARERSEGQIGGMQNPVVRDPKTGQPYVPGSSLKGKLRALLERIVEDIEFNHKGAEDIYRHECTDTACQVCRLMGSAGKQKGEERKVMPIPARLLVRDAFLTPESVADLEKIDTELPFTEWKSENCLDRITSKANPRPMERVPAGAQFRFEMIYNVESLAELPEDLLNLTRLLKLLEDDSLGGSGSRGYGRVSLQIDTLEGRRLAYYAGDGTARIQPTVTDQHWEAHAQAVAQYFAL